MENRRFIKIFNLGRTMLLLGMLFFLTWTRSGNINLLDKPVVTETIMADYGNEPKNESQDSAFSVGAKYPELVGQWQPVFSIGRLSSVHF